MKEDTIRKLLLNLEEARKMIQNRDEEIEKLMNQNRETKTQLETRIGSLELEAESKQRKIHEIEASLARWIEVGQHMKALETKMAHASSENSDLKQRLATKDSELQDANRLNQELSTKVEELRMQLKKALDSMVEVSQRFELKFSELNSRNELIEKEKRDLVEHNKQYQEEFIELKARANRYEYEVELLTAQQQNSMQEFIQSLKRPKESGSPLRSKYQESERLSRLEGRTAEKSHRLLHNMLNQSPYIPPTHRNDSAILNNSIQELNAYLSFDSIQEERKTLSRRASPEMQYKRMHEAVPQPRRTQKLLEEKSSLQVSEQTQTTKLKSPDKGSPPNAERRDPRPSKINPSVESIQKEVENFKAFKSQIKDNMAQRNKALKEKIFS